MIRNSIDRPNVFLTAVPIKKGNIQARRELDGLVPLGSKPNEIQKTMVFVDSRQMVSNVVEQLDARLHPQFQNQEVIMDFSTIISEKRREQTMEQFKHSKHIGKDTRIMV